MIVEKDVAKVTPPPKKKEMARFTRRKSYR